MSGDGGTGVVQPQFLLCLFAADSATAAGVSKRLLVVLSGAIAPDTSSSPFFRTPLRVWIRFESIASFTNNFRRRFSFICRVKLNRFFSAGQSATRPHWAGSPHWGCSNYYTAFHSLVLSARPFPPLLPHRDGEHCDGAAEALPGRAAHPRQVLRRARVQASRRPRDALARRGPRRHGAL